MKRAPLVSVIISNYNYGRFLSEAIDSALNQTYPHTEVIVVDDGSTDESTKIIASYGDRIVPVLKENGGQASAFNAGFAVSQGELVCFLDSDDTWMPNKVENVVAAARAYPEASLIYHQVRPVSVDNEPLNKPLQPNKVLRGNIVGLVACSGGWWPYPQTSGLCFRRVFLREVMDIPEAGFRVGADAYLADSAPFFGSVVGIGEVYSLYRWHGANNVLEPGHRESGREPVGDTKRKRKALQLLHYEKLHYENRVEGLNGLLRQKNIPHRVSLQDHWPYQCVRWKLGEGPNVLALTWQGLRFAGEPSKVLRLRSTAVLWLEMLGLKGVAKWWLEMLGLRRW